MKSSSKQRLRGFTLIELIITLVILGILSVTAVPKFLGSSTEDAYSYRDRTLNALRTVQLRAMQNTAMASCYTLYITSTLIAPPTPDTCIGGADANNTDHLVVQINTQRSDITFNALDSNANIFTQISFDPLGKSNQTCTSQCRIDVGLAGVCISGEGLIYACP
ncbi:prepilin-type N-terminal cleavage/methylation domain-containing protein [Pseudoalteromonas sp. FUC4]|uniref:type II secretion system protein n=1 Tax=Pseudoalteromonas sp. FUC4 TaxID=2511201 RepID=UPI0011F33723|nr:prepilin-type N-terminal cleavage/methylation domain-containing protein [Pseudoalteromonas sp. FUC4]KAA1152390.1 prepilin-type N-terminal cleavage/methylation domain-containing protein [Pseudoalteromonas sp. FUC4]